VTDRCRSGEGATEPTGGGLGRKPRRPIPVDASARRLGHRSAIDGLNASVKALESGGFTDHLEVTVPAMTIPAGQTSLKTKLAASTAVGALAGTLDFEVV
jgi:hypothetical protein